MRTLGLALSCSLLLLVGCAGSTTSAPTPGAPASNEVSDAQLGELDFDVTGTPACQRSFKIGLLALHSFQYELAGERFESALTADPGCAMAAWGLAMSHVHAVWRELDFEKGRAALKRAKGREALSERERAYLETAEALFAATDHKVSFRAWLDAATAMHARFPDDDEVVLQHCLALLGVYGYDPDHLREQMQAGALALEVLARRPNHPGAAHYVIHSFDSPAPAILALPAARAYARIAPASSHALHMPSHTFTHLGMWRDVVPSNVDAVAASVASAKARGGSVLDHDWHAYSWLVAAHIELGQYKRARALIDEARAVLVAAAGNPLSPRTQYVDMVASYVYQAGAWDDVEALVAPVFDRVGDEDPEHGTVACALHAPGGAGALRAPYALLARITAHRLRIEAALRRGDDDDARAQAAELATTYEQTAAWRSLMPPAELGAYDAHIAAVTARATAGSKPTPEQLAEVIKALETLDRSERTLISGPAFLAPSGEILGEVLLAAGRAKEALAHYEQVAVERPNRAAALLGAARAAAAVGLPDRARVHYAALTALWSDADADVASIAEARAGAR